MKAKALAFAALLLAALPACAETTGSAPESAATTEISAEITNATEDAAPENRQVDLAELKEKYPEYFELSAFKGIEVYVWQMSKDSYSCGMMSGTNCLKTLEDAAADSYGGRLQLEHLCGAVYGPVPGACGTALRQYTAFYDKG